MILTDIKHYLMQCSFATLKDIALHFDSEPEAVRGMLEQWIRKGKVSRQRADDSCGNCCKCDVTTTEIYQWRDRSATLFAQPSDVLQVCGKMIDDKSQRRRSN